MHGRPASEHKLRPLDANSKGRKRPVTKEQALTPAALSMACEMDPLEEI